MNSLERIPSPHKSRKKSKEDTTTDVVLLALFLSVSYGAMECMPESAPKLRPSIEPLATEAPIEKESTGESVGPDGKTHEDLNRLTMLDC